LTIKVTSYLEGAKTLRIMTFSIINFSITIDSMKGLFVTLRIKTHRIECRYTERSVLFTVMLSVIILDVVGPP
jgi:hypothetical protein